MIDLAQATEREIPPARRQRAGDPDVELLVIESRLIDRHDPGGALAALDAFDRYVTCFAKIKPERLASERRELVRLVGRELAALGGDPRGGRLPSRRMV